MLRSECIVIVMRGEDVAGVAAVVVVASSIAGAEVGGVVVDMAGLGDAAGLEEDMRVIEECSLRQMCRSHLTALAARATSTAHSVRFIRGSYAAVLCWCCCGRRLMVEGGGWLGSFGGVDRREAL